ncbi:MAG: putative endonuclease [Pseudoalteromonas tetraodonis]|jgi:putative endonuclease
MATPRFSSHALGETPLPSFPGGNPLPLAPDGLKEVMNESRWSVYIIRCGDGSLYTGIATDVERRFGEHVSQGSKAAKYLRGRLPLEIVYRREIGSRSEASKEELRIKRMGVKGKMSLVDGG